MPAGVPDGRQRVVLGTQSDVEAPVPDVATIAVSIPATPTRTSNPADCIHSATQPAASVSW